MARTKEFEISDAVTQALDVFWVHGYKETSLSRLLGATSLHKGSFYGTFESKEKLFDICINHYLSETANPFKKEQNSAKEFIENFFLKKLNCTKSRKAKGCLLMNSAIEFASAENELLKTKLNGVLDKIQENFKKTIASGIENKEFKADVCPLKMSERLLALAFTMEEMGKMGRSRAFLRNIANGTLKDLGLSI